MSDAREMRDPHDSAVETGRARAVVPLGRAPRPPAATELAERVRDALRLALWSECTVAGLDDARIVVAWADGGPDVERVDVDLTGVELTAAEPGATVRRNWAAALAEFAEPVSGENAVARAVRVAASPLIVAGTPVEFSAELRDTPFAWIEGVGGGLGAEVRAEKGPTAGRARVAIAARDIPRLARVLIEGWGEDRIDVLRLRIDLAAAGPRSVAVRGMVRVGRRGLTVGGRLNAVVEVDDAMVLSVPRLRVWSLNPVVAGLLLGMRRDLRGLRTRRIPLTWAGVAVRDVRVEAGDEFVVEVDLGVAST